MMGTSHAATGLLTGGMTGFLLSPAPEHALVCAALGAGAALLPDLDTPGSTAGRSLGAVTELVSTGVRSASRAVYTRTATELEFQRPQDGGHRHLSHTVPACLTMGIIALLLALIPLGRSVGVAAGAQRQTVVDVPQSGRVRDRQVSGGDVHQVGIGDRVASAGGARDSGAAGVRSESSKVACPEKWWQHHVESIDSVHGYIPRI